MNFKNKEYYIAKIKYILGLAVSAILIDAAILFSILFA